MAESQVGQLTVVIAAEENVSLKGVYEMSPNTKLSEMLQIWKDDFALLSHWIFMSASGEVIFQDESITLAEVGETVPWTVTLRAVLIDEPTNEIFVYMKEKFHNLSVKPNETLYEVQWRLQEKPNSLECNGSPLNVMHTVQESGLKNKYVIHEPLCSVSVKMSTGYTKLFQIPSNGMVLHLREKVSFHETNNFSLTYQGRYLKSDESVRPLTQVVEVTTARFIINFRGKRVSWITKDEPIAVSDFVCELAANANIDTKELQSVQFVCIGCQRRIRQSDGLVQRLPVECCEEKSLTLDAVSSSDLGTISESNDATQQIQTLHKHLVEHRSKDLRSANSRCVCRELKDRFGEAGLDYNIITRCSDSLLRTITELEDKIKELNVVIEKMKAEKFESVREIEKLQAANMKRKEEIEILQMETKKLAAENKKVVGKNKELAAENKKVVGKNKELAAENKKVVGENKELAAENKKVVGKNKELAAENKKVVGKNKELAAENKKVVDETKKLVEENERMKKEQNSVSMEIDPRGATGGGPSRPPTRPDEQRGVKLLVVYHPGFFSPASCPEVTSQGEWPFDPGFFYAKCDVRGIRPGSTPFREVVAVLQPLFPGGKISKIQQCLGSAAGRTVTRATSRDGDEELRYDESPYCDVDGAEHSWQEAGKPEWQIIYEGGSVFVCGGGRRTFMGIFW